MSAVYLKYVGAALEIHDCTHSEYPLIVRENLINLGYIKYIHNLEQVDKLTHSGKE